MAMKDRQTLMNYFKKGSIPQEASFEHLIDSGINKIDDGFAKTIEDGLMISGTGGSENLLSFYKNIGDEQAEWTVRLSNEEDDNNDLQISHTDEGKPLLTFNKKGHLGVNEANPNAALDINGWVNSKGRTGRYASESTISANGRWHPITPVLNYCQAFEIVARTGIKNTGKHAIIHAIAVSAYGNSRSKIRKTGGHFDFWKPVKIQLRWTGNTKAYQLEMRCKQNLGSSVDIKYYITQLWSDEEMGIKKQFLEVDNTPDNS